MCYKTHKHPLHFNLYLLLSIVIAASAGLLFGFDTGNIAGALFFIDRSFHASTIQNEFIVSLTILGAFFAALVSGKAVDIYGRRTLLIIAAILYTGGALLGAFSDSLTQIMIARFVLGLAIGISSYVAPLYISEISPERFRGFFVLLNGIAITGGEAIAYGLDYHLSLAQDWRNMFLLGVIPAVILGVGMYMMPCSPRWLVLKGKLSQAKIVLTRFYGTLKAGQELQKIQLHTPRIGSFRSLFFNPLYRKLLLVGLALGIFQQFFGINTVMYYGPFIFQKAGFHSASSDILLTFYMGVVNTLMTIVTGLTVDRFGRRTLLITGSALAAASLMILSYLFHTKTHDAWQAHILLITMITYIIGYCISVGSLFWLIIAEIFPLAVRGQAMSVATAIQWLANFVVSISFLSLLNGLGASVTFGIYALICVAAIFFTYVWIPETKQLRLEEITNHIARE